MALTHQEKIQAQRVIEELRSMLTNEEHLAFIDSVADQFDFTEAEVWAYNYVLREMRADAAKNGTVYRTGKKWAEIMGLGETEAKRLTMALTRLHKEDAILKRKGEGKGAGMEYACEVSEAK